MIKEKSGGFTGSILTSVDPKLFDNGTQILVVFRSETSLIEFDKLAPELLVHLKSSLKNNQIEFKTEVNIEKAKKVLYSNKDKFDHLVKDHPKLTEWAARLGIELI